MYLDENNNIKEDFDGEAEYIFQCADKDAGSRVDVLYEIDSRTHKEIMLQRTKDDESNPKRSI